MESRNISFSFGATENLLFVKTDLGRASELEEVDHVLLEVLHMAHGLLRLDLLGLLCLFGRLLLLILLLLEMLSEKKFLFEMRK